MRVDLRLDAPLGVRPADNKMTRKMKVYRKIIGLLAATLLLVACESDVENLYSNFRAFFRFTPVTSAQPLYKSLNNPGLFCMVEFTTSHTIFKGNDGSSYAAPRTALDQYGRPVYISGFIIGTPSLPDLNSNFYNVAYDLVCPNCYDESYIQRKTQFEGYDKMKCTTCHRSYNLNNNGVVDGGENGRPLFRYRLSYGSDVVVIQN